MFAGLQGGIGEDGGVERFFFSQRRKDTETRGMRRYTCIFFVNNLKNLLPSEV